MDWQHEIEQDAEALGRLAEELVNAVTHGLGLALAIVGSVVMMHAALARGDSWVVGGCAVFTATLVAVYLASTLSHSFREPQRRRLFRTVDQACIYLLIAGTYTPFGLVYLRSGWLHFLTLAMWGIALTGFFSKIIWRHRVEAVATSLYVLLGWLPITGIGPIVHLVPKPALWWMLAGGLCYTLGTVFLTFDTRVRYFHAVWHLLVIAGSACHFFGILWYVVPAA